MPHVQIHLAGSLSEDQRRELTRQVTEVVSQTTGKSKDYVWVSIHEVPRDRFAIAGKLLSDK